MDIAEFCGLDLIELNLEAKNKEDLIEEMVEVLARSHKVNDKDQVLQAVREREHVATTGVGYKVALPHAKTDSVDGLVIGFGKSEEGIEYEALDNKKVHIVFLVVGPTTAVSNHLSVLAQLSLLIKNHDNIDKLINTVYPQEVLNFLKDPNS